MVTVRLGKVAIILIGFSLISVHSQNVKLKTEAQMCRLLLLVVLLCYQRLCARTEKVTKFHTACSGNF